MHTCIATDLRRLIELGMARIGGRGFPDLPKSLN